MYQYCAHCQTQRCEIAAKSFEEIFKCRAIQPMMIQHKRTGGKVIDQPVHMMPGYLFLFFEKEFTDLHAFSRVDGFIRLLRYTDGEYALKGDDAEFAHLLLERNGVIGRTKVYKEGQRIRICKGAFENVQAEILSVDRRYNRMVILLPFTHMSVKACVEYDMVEDAVR